MSDEFIISGKDAEWLNGYFQRLMLGANFKSANSTDFRESLFGIYEVMERHFPDIAPLGAHMAKEFYQEQAVEFPLAQPDDDTFEAMGRISAAVLFALRIVETAEDGLKELAKAAEEAKEKEDQFREDNC